MFSETGCPSHEGEMWGDISAAEEERDSSTPFFRTRKKSDDSQGIVMKHCIRHQKKTHNFLTTNIMNY